MEAIVAEVAQACEGQITRYQACVDEDVRTHEQRCRGLKNELSECALKGAAILEQVQSACSDEINQFRKCIEQHVGEEEEHCMASMLAIDACTTRVMQSQ